MTDLDETTDAAESAHPETSPQEESFESYYARVIAPALVKRETSRRNAMRRLFIVMGLGLVAALVLLGYGLTNPSELPTPGLIFGIVVILVMAAGFGSVSLSGVAVGVKEELVGCVAAYAGMSYRRKFGTPTSIGRFRAQRLLPSYNRSTFEDLFSGTRHGAAYTLFEATLLHHSRDSKGRSRTLRVFRGQLIQVAFPRTFHGRTLVLRDAGVFNALQSMGSELARVGLVDLRFERVFEVFATDQVEARYLLTPTFMERLLDLETMFKGKRARAAFVDGDVLIAIEGGNLFEPGSMFKPLDDPARAAKVLREIRSVQGVIDALLEPRDEPSLSS